MERQAIQNKIYEIRGRRVMSDFDPAMLYGIETKVLKQAVRRNMKRFEGEDFMFEVTREELLRCQIGTLKIDSGDSRSQIVTLNKGRGSNIKYLPFAFSELGVAMDSLEIKQLAMENSDIRRLLEEYIEETEDKFDEVYAALTELAEHRKSNPPKPRNPIGYRK